MFDQLLTDLSRPEYVHVILNPLPVYGTALGTLGLLIALFFKAPQVRIPPLILLLVSGISLWPVMEFGEKAESRVENQFDQDGREWFETHEHRAKKAAPLFYSMAGCAFAACCAGIFFQRPARALGIITLLVACATTGAGIWIGQAGGKIRHPEFRSGPPPARSGH